MKVAEKHYRTIWSKPDNPDIVQAINQQVLPHQFEVMDIATVEQMCRAIKDMYIRGAGLIGAAAGYGMMLAALEADESSFDEQFAAFAAQLKATRPTASNLAWAVDRQLRVSAACSSVAEKREAARREAQAIADEDAEHCRRIGEHGIALIREISRRKQGAPVNILTHCNAGWLAFVDYGSATAPIYAAHDAGIPVHVWVDETRPRNQGASLTAWELGKHGVPHHLIADNTGGHLMQHGEVDLVITGTDRTTANGDVANKIGTYLKALAANDNNIPFYVALPSSTFDFTMSDGVKEIPIEERDPDEVRRIQGLGSQGLESVLLCPAETPARNFGFDVTPARLISGLICERGICAASREGISALFPEHFTEAE